MKHLWMIIGFLLLCASPFAQDFIVTSAEYIVVSGNVSDTLGRTRLTPDSIRIVVTDSAGTELSDAWFEAADAQAVLNGDIITFFDQWNDINGAASVGTFSLMVTIASDAQNNVDLFSNYNYTIRGVTVGVEAMHNDVAGLNGWAPILDNDSLIIDQSTLEDMTVATVTTVTGGALEASLFDPATDSVIVDESELVSATIATVTSGATSAGQTLIIDTVNGIIDSAQNVVDAMWDEVLTGATHNIATSAGKRLRDVSHIIIADGTAQRGNSLGIVLASVTSFADAVINGNIITIIGGTGIGQSRYIHDFTGATDSITLHDGDEWTTTPDVSSIYIINPAAQVSVIHVDDSAKADIADAVWNELVANHTTALTYGDTLPKMLRLIQDTTESQDDWIATRAGLDSLKTSIIAAAGDVVDSSTNSASEFKTNLSNAVDDHYINQIMVFTTGTNAGQSRRILDYIGTPKYIKVSPAFGAEPTAGDDFAIMFYINKVSVSSIDANVITATSIATDAFDADAFATDAIDELWEYDTANFDAAAGVGTAIKNIQDTTDAQGSAGAGAISDADMVSIADTVWKKAFATAWTAGSIGDSLTTGSYVQGSAAGVTLAAIWDTLSDSAGAALIVLRDGIDSLKTNIIAVAGDIVDSSTNSASEFKTDLSNAVDGYYDFQFMIFTTGINAGQSRRIINYYGASKYIFVDPPFEAEPTAGDDFTILFNSANVNVYTMRVNIIGANVLATSAVEEIAQTTWNIAFNTGFTAGSMGDSLNNSTYVQGTASGLSAVDIWNVAFGTAFTGGSMGDSINNSSYVQGTASGLTAVDIWNVAFNTGFTAGSMGDSINNSSYVRADVSSLALEASLFDGNLNLDNATGTLSDAQIDNITVIAGTVSDKTGYSLTASQWELVWYLIDTTNVDSSDIGAWFKNNIAGGAGGLDTLSDDYRDALLSLVTDTLAGRGMAEGNRSYAVRRYVIDTSGTDDTLANVTITARTATGSLILSMLTNSEGWVDFSIDSGEVRWTATKGAAYIFNQLIDTITAADTADITGYNVVIASPSNADLATVYGNIRDIQNVRLEGVSIVVTRVSGNVSDTADGIFWADLAIEKGSDTGYFFFELPRTNQYDDTTRGLYTFTGTYNGTQVFKIENVTVPSSGNLDLGTIIAARKEN